jgi:hypothetical protein
MITKIDNTLAEIRRKNEEHYRKWDVFNKEQALKWDDFNQKWEDQNRKWDENNKKWDKQVKINQDLISEIKKLNKKFDSSLGVLGACWGLYSEASFKNALKSILEDSFGVQVLNTNEFDDKGVVFGRPNQIELDIIIKNGILILCKIKFSMSKSDMNTFDRKVSYYQQQHHNRIVNRKIVISPMVDE